MSDSEPAPMLLPVEASPAPAAPFSFFSEEEEHQIRGLSTGEGLRKRDPLLYNIVVRLLGQDAPIREIKRLTGLHHRTISAVREREGETIDTLRKSLGERALRTAALAIERMEDQIVNGSAKLGELAMAAGILVDKGQVLTGGVTSRTERVEADSVEDRLRNMLSQIPAADVTEIQPAARDTGIPAGNVCPMAEGGAAAGDESAQGEGDIKSPVLPSEAGHESTCESVEGMIEDGSAGVSTRGGGGSAFDGGVSQ